MVLDSELVGTINCWVSGAVCMLVELVEQPLKIEMAFVRFGSTKSMDHENEALD
jgi:hypothetical protein